MGVTVRHPEYLKYHKQWKLVRDCLEGQEAIKLAGEAYLPMSGGQAVQEKKALASGGKGPWTVSKTMARFPELLEPIAMGFTGLATRIPWKVEGLPKSMEYIMDDAGCNLGVEGWQSKLIYSGLTMGRSVLFTDAPQSKGKPKIQFYGAESFTNWQTETHRGEVLSLAAFKESRRKEQTDIFGHDSEDVYRVVRILDGRVVVEIYKPNGDTKADTLEDTLEVSYTEMPIVICGTTENCPAVQRPPLIGIADCAVSAYQMSALLKWSMRAALDPILLALGFKSKEIQIIGAGTVLEKNVTPDQASLEYISAKVEGWELAQSEIDREITRAKESGHALKERSGVESGSSRRQETQSKTATLKSIDRCSAQAFEDALNMMARMQSLPDKIKVISSLKYTDDDIEAVALTAITSAVEKNQLPREATIQYVQDRGMLEGQELDEVLGKLDEQAEQNEARTVGMDNAMFGAQETA